jgi:hypothetical protein
MQIIDYDNGINKIPISEKEAKHELKKKIEEIRQNAIVVEYNSTEYFIYELKEHYNRIFQSDYCTEIIITFDADNNDEDDFAHEALRYFIREYRLATKNYWVLEPDDLVIGNNVLLTYFHQYSDSERKIPVKDRLRLKRNISLGIKQFRLQSNRFNNNFSLTDIEKHAELLDKRLQENNIHEFFEESLIRATQEIKIFNNYKYGFLELFFIIESCIVDFLTDEKLKLGISNKKIKEFRTEVGISYLINIELPLVLRNIEDTDKEMLNKIDVMRKKRNDLVHNRGDITNVEANDALDVTVAFVNMLSRIKMQTIGNRT